VRDLRVGRGPPVHRALTGDRRERRSGGALGAAGRVGFASPALLLSSLVVATVTVTASGCAINSLGLDFDSSVGSDAPADLAGEVDNARDAPAEAPADGAIDSPLDAGADAACASCDPDATFILLPGKRVSGTTTGRSNRERGSCGGGDAPEAIFKIALPVTSDVFITTHGTRFNTVLYLRRDNCCGEEVACNDDQDGRTTSVIAQRGLEPGTYYIYVDGATAADVGAFSLDVYATPAAAEASEACGNPTRIPSDGIDGDTCKSVDDYSPPAGCSSAVSGPNGRDQVFYFVLDAPGSVTFSTCDSTCIDTVLYLRDVCSDPASVPLNGCDDDSCRASGSCQLAGNLVQSRVTAILDAGVHYLVLDTFAATSQAPCGKFTITPTGVP
jgi:hypothetical protein